MNTNLKTTTMKTITLEFLKKHNACSDGIDWCDEKGIIDLPADKIIQFLLENNKLGWANWLIVKVMNKRQYVQYAIYAAEKVLSVFEKEYPDDKRPFLAIKAAKNYLKKPCKSTKMAAHAAADAVAYAAAHAAYAAADAAYAAANAAYAAADAVAYAASNVAYAASNAAANVAYAASNAAAVKKEIITFGLSLIK